MDPPHALQVADVERVLGSAVARMLALKLAMGLLLGLGLFQREPLSAASSALSRLVMVSRSWRCHTQHTPAGETKSPRFRNSERVSLWKTSHFWPRRTG
jgi:hypothetical protein